MKKEPRRLSDGSLPPQLPWWFIGPAFVLMFAVFVFILYWVARVGGLFLFLRGSIEGG